MDIQQKIENIDWDNCTRDINEVGYSQISTLLTPEECDDIISQYDNETLYRKTISMER